MGEIEFSRRIGRGRCEPLKRDDRRLVGSEAVEIADPPEYGWAAAEAMPLSAERGAEIGLPNHGNLAGRAIPCRSGSRPLQRSLPNR